MSAFLSDPRAIENESYRLIGRELAGCRLTGGEKAVLTRIIHATGDPGYARLVSFGHGFVAAAVTALRQGAGIFTDVEMVRSGINAGLAGGLGNRVFCAVSEPEVLADAQKTGRTRAMAAMDRLAGLMEGGLAVIGNAPTALFRLLELIESGQARPAAIVGVPVGQCHLQQCPCFRVHCCFP